MTVKELIDKLKEFDENNNVLIEILIMENLQLQKLKMMIMML